MNKKRYQKMLPRPNEISKKMNRVAAFIVDNDCRTLDDLPITGEDRDVLIYDKAMDMFIGEKLTKKSNIAKGILIGSIATVVVLTTTKIIKKNRKNKDKE